MDKNHKILHYSTGEYGGQTMRPHYHSILFNFPANIKNERLIKSIWKRGFISLQSVKSGKGVARYVAEHQNKIDLPISSEYQCKPFHLMSLRPAIGLNWLLKHKAFFTFNRRRGSYLEYGRTKNKWVPAPRYYLNKIYTKDEIKDVVQEYKDGEKKYLQSHYKMFRECETDNAYQVLLRSIKEQKTKQLMQQKATDNLNLVKSKRKKIL